MTSWRESKDAGREAFSEGRYPEALARYSEAVDRLLASDERDRSAEHQVLLSNVIACRLKMGGRDMAGRAVGEAKKCVSLDDRWAKAHVRLASAYIALGGHSNDACLSLQRALSLDRDNRVAREMLVGEMRRRNDRERTGAGASGGDAGGRGGEGSAGGGSRSTASSWNDGDSDYHPTDETPGFSYPTTPSAPPMPGQPTTQGSGDSIDVDDIEPPDAHNSLTFSQRAQHHLAQLIGWFHSQSDDIQALLKVGCVFLFLYVLLGGRFGFNYALGGEKGVGHRGNYGEGNAYDRYYSASSSRNHRYSTGGEEYDRKRTGTHGADDDYGARRRAASSGYNDRTSTQNDKYYSRHDDGEYYEPRHRRTSSYQMPNLYDGSLVSMAILMALGLLCHRLGINPFQALWMLNLLQRRGGHHRLRGWGYGGYQGGGVGMGGGFGGFGGRRYGFGRRRY